eukprot:m.240255 g.240255  ORF g.240255 m.240255 type:complete len:83 (+) comp15305_c0_seq4:547-795(+)
MLAVVLAAGQPSQSAAEIDHVVAGCAFSPVAVCEAVAVAFVAAAFAIGRGLGVESGTLLVSVDILHTVLADELGFVFATGLC